MTRTLPLLLVALLSIVLPSCKPGSSSAQQEVVVLYTSADDQFAKLVVEGFTKETGIEVLIVGDTEATKTTGLVARLKAEASNPQGDVWWSSEPFGTIDLARSGVLEPGAMNGLTDENWPERLHDPDWTWTGFANRGRVIVFASDRVDQPPTTLRDLAQAEWKGRVGMARPQFGTTRGHMGILVSRWGLPEFERWLTMLNSNGLRLYDGNASVVRAVAMGEIDVGLTDTDDVWSGQRNDWAVSCAYESYDPPMELTTQPSRGPTLLPNTVGIIKGGPHPDHARQLAEYLVSQRVERELAMSESRNIPVNPALIELFVAIAPASLTAPNPNRVDGQSFFPDFIDAEARIQEAMGACDRLLSP